MERYRVGAQRDSTRRSSRVVPAPSGTSTASSSTTQEPSAVRVTVLVTANRWWFPRAGMPTAARR